MMASGRSRMAFGPKPWRSARFLTVAVLDTGESSNSEAVAALKFSFSEPGVAISAAAHVAVLVALLVGFSEPKDVDDVKEAVPVETISTTDFNQIMKGDKASKDVTKEPTTKVDKVAAVEEQHSQPPQPEAQKEVPLPPPPPPPPPAEPRRRLSRASDRRRVPIRSRRRRCRP